MEKWWENGGNGGKQGKRGGNGEKWGGREGGGWRKMGNCEKFPNVQCVKYIQMCEVDRQYDNSAPLGDAQINPGAGDLAVVWGPNGVKHHEQTTEGGFWQPEGAVSA